MVSISHLLNRTVEIKRPVSTRDDQGGHSTVPTLITTVRGRRQAAGGSDRFLTGREEALVSHVWYFDFNVDVRVNDMIVEGTVSYLVLAILQPSLDDFLKIQTEEVQVG